MFKELHANVYGTNIVQLETIINNMWTGGTASLVALGPNSCEAYGINAVKKADVPEQTPEASTGATAGSPAPVTTPDDTLRSYGNTPEELRPYRRSMQIIFQDPMASLDPRMRVRDAVAEGMQVGSISCANALP